jgi:hypothetical protein
MPYFCPKRIKMTQKRNTGIYWLLFFASTAAFLAAIALHWEWLTFILPFVGTSFVKAMDII